MTEAQILTAAPNGWTHVDKDGDYYIAPPHPSCPWEIYNSEIGEWRPTGAPNGCRSADDIKYRVAVAALNQVKHVSRQSDASLLLTFSSCRAASEFEKCVITGSTSK